MYVKGIDWDSVIWKKTVSVLIIAVTYWEDPVLEALEALTIQLRIGLEDGKEYSYVSFFPAELGDATAQFSKGWSKSRSLSGFLCFKLILV